MVVMRLPTPWIVIPESLPPPEQFTADDIKLTIDADQPVKRVGLSPVKMGLMVPGSETIWKQCFGGPESFPKCFRMIQNVSMPYWCIRGQVHNETIWKPPGMMGERAQKK